jgi:hypothetical protein
MPILVIALIALFLFLIIGGLCVLAVAAEAHQIKHRATGAEEPVTSPPANAPAQEKPKARAAHA